PTASPPAKLRRRLQLRQAAQNPQGPHPIRIHLQSLDFRATQIQNQPAPANAGTKHLGSHGAQDHETPAFPIRASEPGRGAGGISRFAVVARQQPTSPRPTPGDKRFPVSSGPSRPPQRTKCRERASQTAERTKERWVNRLRLPSAYRLSKRALSQTRLHTRFAAVNESVRAILR